MLYRFFKYFGNNKNAFLKYSLLSFIAGILELFGVALTYPFVLKLLSKEDYAASIISGLTIVALFIAKNIFMIFYTSLQAKFTKNVEAELNLSFMKYFICAPYPKTVKISFAQKSNILNFLIPNVINNFILRLLNLSVNFFIFILISAFLAIKFPFATLLTIGCAILLIFIQNKIFKPKLNEIAQKITKASALYTQKSNEALLNLKSVKVSNNEKFFFDNYKSAVADFYQLGKKTLFYNAIPPYITEPFIIILLFILLVIISIQNYAQPENLVASFAVIVTAVFRLAPTISRIQVNLNGINAAKPITKELLDIYETFDIPQEPEEKSFYKLQNSIELKGVSYSYPQNKLALKDINLTINKGEFIGIAGLSGAGKSTLADMIAGLIKPDRGEILIDGKIVNLPLKVGYITQEYNIINANIRDNVIFGQQNIDDNAVIEALKKACLYDFIEHNYKEGIYANPFIDATGFSQGQKQRLAIARALYSDPDILILDEATASLDLKTEDEICHVLNGLKGEKTIIAIAHRLSTIKSADKIIFIKDAQIDGIAPFNELVNTNPNFRELVKLASLN